MKFLRMKPGHGEVLLAEGDVEVAAEEERLIEAFREQLDQGMWAAVPADQPRRPARGADGEGLRRDPARRRARHLLPARGRGPLNGGAPMLLALSATAIVIVALLWEVALPHDPGGLRAPPRRAARASRRRPRRLRPRAASAAPSSAPASCCARASTTRSGRCTATSASSACGAGSPTGPSQGGSEETEAGAPYAYLIYPHKPIVAYLPQTRTLLNEYCVAFPDETRPYGSARLPDSDDVLAKWMALTGDERAPGREREHAPARAARSTRARCGATSGACRVGARAHRARTPARGHG